MSDKEWEQIDKRKVLDEAIKRVCINQKLPTCCSNLQKAGYSNGPEALVSARNNLVHAHTDRNLSLDALLEARNLGQWYAELLLLKKFEYQGCYANRMTYIYKGKWRTEEVPWQSKAL